jgi:hypothetical protein
MFNFRRKNATRNEPKATTTSHKPEATSGNKSKKIIDNKVGGDAYLDILMGLAQTSTNNDKKVEKKQSYIGRILGESPTFERGLKQRANTDDTEPCDLETPCDSPSSARHSELSSENCPSRQLQILSSWDDDDIMIYYAQSPSPSMLQGNRRFTFSDSEEEDDNPIIRYRTNVPQYGSDKVAARKEFYLSRVQDSITEKTSFDSGTCGSI